MLWCVTGSSPKSPLFEFIGNQGENCLIDWRCYFRHRLFHLDRSCHQVFFPSSHFEHLPISCRKWGLLAVILRDRDIAVRSRRVNLVCIVTIAINAVCGAAIAVLVVEKGAFNGPQMGTYILFDVLQVKRDILISSPKI